MKRDRWFSQSKSETDLQRLIEELAEQEPRQDRVQRLMENLGMEYTSDPILQIERVLCALSGMDLQSLTDISKKSKESKDASNLQ